jgi:hypothetical protein
MFETLECLFTLIMGLVWLVSKIMGEERQDTSASQEAEAAIAVAVAVEPAAESYEECRACGKPNPPDSAFCGECGMPLEPLAT